jgi:site-specific DNA-methyltransferase (adenine-specific)
MVEDRFEPGYRQLIIAAKARDRYWDGDAVRVPHAPHTQRYLNGKLNTKQSPQGHNGTRSNPGQTAYYSNGNPAGAPLLDWWLVSDEYEIEPREESSVTARYIVGDALEVLATLEPGSVDLVMSSPPFLALRSYLPADHPDKAREIGSEGTPGAFLDVMLDVVEACARVLAPHGSLVFELGDTYSGTGGGGGDFYDGGLKAGQPGFTGAVTASSAELRDANAAHWRQKGNVGHEGGPGWPLGKSKVLIPQLFAVALAYGFNPLTGRQTEPWRVRNTVAWCRPNPPVGRDGDKFRPATSFLTVAAKARDRYWDGDAVRTAHKLSPEDRDPPTYAETTPDGNYNGTRRNPGQGRAYYNAGNPVGAPLLDWWEIPTAPYKGAHYATYPPDLVVPVVKACCPQRVCRVCGQPSRRITNTEYEPHGARTDEAKGVRGMGVQNGEHAQHMEHGRASKVTETVGWSDCGHDDYRPGTVLDPFAGSGTTLAVATGHGLEAIGIDLDSRNAELAYERIGMFVEVEYPERAA